MDGSKWMILNLKRLNKFVGCKHFKIESLQNVLELIKPGVYMATIYIKDLFYSRPVHKNHQAYLTFFVEKYLKFVCMPCQMDRDQPCKSLQIFQKYHFLSLQKNVSYLQFTLLTHICKVLIIKIVSLIF